MIEDYYTTELELLKRVEEKIKGKLTVAYQSYSFFKAAVFVPSTTRTIRYEKQDFILALQVYCSIDIPVCTGDRLISEETNYDVISVTDSIGHHYELGLVKG